MEIEKVHHKHFAPKRYETAKSLTALLNEWLEDQPDVRIISIQMVHPNISNKSWQDLHVWYYIKE